MTGLYEALKKREAEGRPIRIGLIGAGKFGSMFISQIPFTPGIRLAGLADLSTERALDAFKQTNYPTNLYDTTARLSISDCLGHQITAITTSAALLIAEPSIDVILEITGSPAAGVQHALLCAQHDKHIVMINVEADVLAGPLLQRHFSAKNLIYSMAYGDQPALIAELVDWARVSGFQVVCAGKGTKHLPDFHYSTPATVWDHYGLTASEAKQAGMNAQMFNSFLDGTKSALEMAAVANATGLQVPSSGLGFPPCSTGDLPRILKPTSEGGTLETCGIVEVVSCLNLDGSDIANNIRWGVFVVFKAPTEYQRACFRQYGMATDESGWYAAQSKPYHLIGLELGYSVASIMVRGEPTGSTREWHGDVLATAKRDLNVDETLDGEGGFMVYGLLVPARASLERKGLPIGLAHGLKLKQRVGKDQMVSWDDVDWEAGGVSEVIQVRREMEDMFRREWDVDADGVH